MKTSIRRSTGEQYFGVEITPDGRLIVAERSNGGPLPPKCFPAGDSGARALREHIQGECGHPHVCIKACGAAALALAAALVPVPGVEVTLVAPRALQDGPASAEEIAVRLARLAERLF